MSKKILALGLAVLLILASFSTVFADGEYESFYYSNTNSLTDSEVADYNGKAAAVAAECGVSLYAVTVRGLSDFACSSIEELTELLSQEMEFGTQTNGEYVLLTLSLGDREYDMFVMGEYANSVFSNSTCELVGDYFLPYFGEDDWYQGFLAYLDACYMCMSGSAETPYAEGIPNYEYAPEYDVQYSSQPLPTASFLDRYLSVFPTTIAAGFMAAIIYILLQAKKMKSAKTATNANKYISGNPVFVISKDTFTHQTTHIIHHEPPQNNGGGGMSHSFGGGGSHHSGKF